MEGKSKTKGKRIVKVLLIAASLILTAVLSISITMAWFFDKDWASKEVIMAGAVGITLKDTENVTSGAGNLHFNITTNYVYPGQAIDVSIQAYNDSTTNPSTSQSSKGSPCYVRASFKVFTDIGLESEVGVDETEANATAIYEYLFGLVSDINHDHVAANGYSYRWIYFRHKGSTLIDGKYYFNGTGTTTDTHTTDFDDGYFYLCYDPDTLVSGGKNYTPLNGGEAFDISTRNTNTGAIDTLYPLAVSSGAAFLWNGTFVMPWTLTNYSADRHMVVIVEFQAIQTFIPKIHQSTGLIDTAADNQLEPENCKFYDKSVQTVFNSCNFGSLNTNITAALETAFGVGCVEGTDYANVSLPYASISPSASYAIYPGGENSAAGATTAKTYSYAADGNGYHVATPAALSLTPSP